MNRRHFIQTIIATLGGSAVVKPAQAQPIPLRLLLLETPLAGFQFYSGAGVFSQLQPGDPLRLARDHENRYDPNAVELHWRERLLGYLPSKNNVVIAQMMDRGETVSANIVTLRQSVNPWDRVGLEVWWEGKATPHEPSRNTGSRLDHG